MTKDDALSHQPVAWMYELAKYYPSDVRGRHWSPELSKNKPYPEDGLVRGLVPLYTSPPKREWVGLTDDEIIQAYGSVGGTAEWAIGGMADVGNFYLAIEAKLKEKNT